MLDCDPSEVFKDSANFPDWSECWTLKNGTNECGEGIEVPFNAYKKIVYEDIRVSTSTCNIRQNCLLIQYES